MKKIVLDTNILVSALLSENGNPFGVIGMVFVGEATPCLTDDIIEEYSEVLFRPKLGLPKSKVIDLLYEISRHGIFVESKKSDILFVDESDRKFYDAAKTNGALLITGNLRHYPSEAFILSPVEFLRRCFCNSGE